MKTSDFSSNTYEMSLSGINPSGECSELNTLSLSSGTVLALLTLVLNKPWSASSCYMVLLNQPVDKTE